jgi:uncharacterized membrane protein
MTNVVHVLRFINIFCAAITCGGLVMVGMAVYPAMKQFEPKITAQIHRAIDLLPDAYMRPSTIITGIAALLILILHTDLRLFTTVFTIIGLAGTLGIIITSEFFNVRINAVVHGWKDDYVAPEYPQMLQRWGRFHWIRTTCSLVALVCYIIAGLAH